MCKMHVLNNQTKAYFLDLIQKPKLIYVQRERYVVRFLQIRFLRLGVYKDVTCQHCACMSVCLCMCQCVRVFQVFPAISTDS